MDPVSLADSYYEAFRKHSDFSKVPLTDDLVFRGPSGVLEGPAAFRQVVAGLAQGVAGLSVRHQLCTDDKVVTVYDFDLGMPDGPIPMAEVLTMRDGAIAEIELIFDARRLTGSAT